MPVLAFTKMQGTGNDYIFVDLFSAAIDFPAQNFPSWKKLATQLSDRHFGIGGDGLVLIERSSQADAKMRMFNADGSEGEMCGNAIRCVGKYLADRALIPHLTANSFATNSPLTIETKAGIRTLYCEWENQKVTRVRVDMGKPVLTAAEIPTTLSSGDGRAIEVPLQIDSQTQINLTAVSMGNPHAVVFVEKISDAWVLGVGPKVENLTEYFPRRVNVEFIECLGHSELNLRVWERGSGETLACGTGACAALVAAAITGRSERRAIVHLRGGDLEIAWGDAETLGGDLETAYTEDDHIWMTGNAIEVFSGVVDLDCE